MLIPNSALIEIGVERIDNAALKEIETPIATKRVPTNINLDFVRSHLEYSTIAYNSTLLVIYSFVLLCGVNKDKPSQF